MTLTGGCRSGNGLRSMPWVKRLVRWWAVSCRPPPRFGLRRPGLLAAPPHPPSGRSGYSVCALAGVLRLTPPPSSAIPRPTSFCAPASDSRPRPRAGLSANAARVASCPPAGRVRCAPPCVLCCQRGRVLRDRAPPWAPSGFCCWRSQQAQQPIPPAGITTTARPRLVGLLVARAR